MLIRYALPSIGGCLLLTSLLIVPARGAVVAPITGYDYASANALANGITTIVTVNNVLPINQIVGLSSTTSQAEFGGMISAEALLPNPGQLILSAPGTAAGLADIPDLPEYPAEATASYPSQPSDEVKLTPTSSFGGGGLAAAVTQDSAGASANLGNYSSATGGVPGFSVGSISTTAEGQQLTATSYRATATNTTDNVSLLGGLVKIGTINSSVTATIKDGKATTAASAVTVSDVQVATVPVEITNTGIEALGDSMALAPIVSQLTEPLASQGVTIQTTPVTQTVNGTTATVTSGALAIDYQTVVNGDPAQIQVLLGQSQAAVAASGPQTGALAGPAGPGSPVGIPPAAAITAPLIALAQTRGGAATSPPAVGTAPAVVASPPVAAEPGAAVAFELKPIDFRSVCLWLLLAGFALILGSQLIDPLGRESHPPPADVRELWRW